MKITLYVMAIINVVFIIYLSFIWIRYFIYIHSKHYNVPTAVTKKEYAKDKLGWFGVILLFEFVIIANIIKWRHDHKPNPVEYSMQSDIPISKFRIDY